MGREDQGRTMRPTGPTIGSGRGRRGCLVIVCGLPGSGKTTTAKRLVAERGGLRLSPDEWMAALGSDVWHAALRERVEALQWSVGQDLLRSGQTVVIEWGTWARAERDALRVRARGLGASVELHHLDVPLDELWRRLHERDLEDPPITPADLERWSALFEAPDAVELSLYDPAPGPPIWRL